MKKLVLSLFTFLIVSSVYAQTKFPLTIICSEMEADVYVNNRLYTKTTPNLQIQLPPAVYSIKIAKAGFNEFNSNVKVKAGGTVLSVDLQPLSAPAQIKGPTPLVPTFPLNIVSNVPGAQVFINDQFKGTTPFGQNVIGGGHYNIRVSAPGYSDFTQTVTVKSPTQLNVMLQGSSSQLIISSNVAGADVYINGNLAGKTPFQAQVPQGSYNVLVKAPGYLDFNQSVVVGGGQNQVNAMLQGMSYQVNFDANVRGAVVFLNGQQYGQTPCAANLNPGTYSVAVRAPGYVDYQAQISVNGPQALNVALQPQTAPWQFAVPNALSNRDIKPGSMDNGMQLWIDGAPQPEIAGPIFSSGQLTPGRHTIRFVSGGLSVETQVDIQAGKAYTFEPFMGITIK